MRLYISIVPHFSSALHTNSMRHCHGNETNAGLGLRLVFPSAASLQESGAERDGVLGDEGTAGPGGGEGRTPQEGA